MHTYKPVRMAKMNEINSCKTFHELQVAPFGGKWEKVCRWYDKKIQNLIEIGLI